MKLDKMHFTLLYNYEPLGTMEQNVTGLNEKCSPKLAYLNLIQVLTLFGEF